MKHLALLTFAVALAACVCLSAASSVAASSGDSIAILARSGPHQITANKDLITF